MGQVQKFIRRMRLHEWRQRRSSGLYALFGRPSGTWRTFPDRFLYQYHTHNYADYAVVETPSFRPSLEGAWLRSGSSPYYFASRWVGSFLDQADADGYELAQRSHVRLMAAIPGFGIRDRYLRLQLVALAQTASRDWVDTVVPQLFARYRKALLRLFPRKALRVLRSDWRYWQALCFNRAFLLNIAQRGPHTLAIRAPLRAPRIAYRYTRVQSLFGHLVN